MRAISVGAAVAVGLGLAGAALGQAPYNQKFTGPTVVSDVARPGQFQPSMLNAGGNRFSLRSLLPNFGLPSGSSIQAMSNFGPAGTPPLGASDGTKYLKAFGFQQLKFQ